MQFYNKMKNYLLLGIVCLSQLFAELLYPPNNSHLSQIEVMFKWEGEATKTYVFEISDQTNFASSFINHLFYHLNHRVSRGYIYFINLGLDI